MIESLADRLEKCTGRISGTVFRSLFNEVRKLESTLAERDKEIERLRKCCSQRGARMQIMRSWVVTAANINWDYIREWFDEQGVPVKCEALSDSKGE